MYSTQKKPLTEQEEFERAAAPLIQYLNTKCSPHMSVIITSNNAELLQGIMIAQK